MYNSLIIYYAEYFLNNKNGFLLLGSGVAIQMLSRLYNTFISDGSAEPLDKLANEKLDKYKQLGIQYHTEKYGVDKVMQSAYVLELITSND
jgi:hypothetical protein